METWHPRATRVQPSDGHTGLSYIGVPWKIVLHTTETDAYSPNTGSYYGNPFWPHATITDDTIYQHLPIDVGAYALAHESGPETNRANAVQCEIVWRADNADWPDELLKTVADWVLWVAEQTGAPLEVAEMHRDGVTLATVDSPIRFRDQPWLDFTGICGHANVPGGNDHWDPGRLPVDKLHVHLGNKLPHEGDLRMLTFRYIFQGLDWVFDGPSKLFFQLDNPDQITKVLDPLGVPALGEVNEPVHRRYSELAKAANFAG